MIIKIIRYFIIIFLFSYFISSVQTHAFSYYLKKTQKTTNIPYSKRKTVKLIFNKFVIKAEIADTHSKQQTGLMFRRNLAYNRGMLFVFKKPNLAPIWMKNTYIPLDIIWLDRTLKVIHIHKKAEPFSTVIMSSPTPAKYVLEINAGLSDKMSLKKGVTLLKEE